MKIIDKQKINIRTSCGIFEIVLEKWDGDKGYIIRVPKCPEIITQSDNIKESKIMAREAIELCVECEKYEHHTNIKSQRNSKIVVTSGI